LTKKDISMGSHRDIFNINTQFQYKKS